MRLKSLLKGLFIFGLVLFLGVSLPYNNMLTAYAADQTDANWDAVVKAFVDGWKTEYELIK